MNITSNKINSNEMGPPIEPIARNIITPKRHLSNLQVYIYFFIFDFIFLICYFILTIDLLLKIILQSQDGNSSDTPLINKRLSLLMNKTPQSPFHVSTPETPYGQVFKPNPSPDTRKGWVKWVDNFPDLRVEEPPLKKRALSTVIITFYKYTFNYI